MSITRRQFVAGTVASFTPLAAPKQTTCRVPDMVAY